MKRRLFNVVAGLALVICVATAVLWARCYRRYPNYDAWTLHRGARTLVFDSRRGSLTLMSVDPTPHSAPAIGRSAPAQAPIFYAYVIVTFPDWVVVSLSSGIVTLWILRHRMKRPSRPGFPIIPMEK